MAEHPMTTHVREQLRGFLLSAQEQAEKASEVAAYATEQYEQACQNVDRLRRALEELGPEPEPEVAEARTTAAPLETSASWGDPSPVRRT